MSTCPDDQRISAYHDGRIVGNDAAQLKNHLAECSRCADLLEHYRAISQLLASTRRPHVPSIVRHRLHQGIDRGIDSAMDRGMLRIGWTLSGIAASVLVVGSAFLMHVKQTPEAPPPWMGVATTVEADRISRTASSPAAQFYLADASPSSSDTQ